MRLNQAFRAVESPIPCWTAAEFLDVPCQEGALLRAVVCPLGPAKWQAIVLYLSGTGSGEVISTTAAKTAAEAHEIAASELDKCIHDPIA